MSQKLLRPILYQKKKRIKFSYISFQCKTLYNFFFLKKKFLKQCLEPYNISQHLSPSLCSLCTLSSQSLLDLVCSVPNVLCVILPPGFPTCHPITQSTVPLAHFLAPTSTS